jgi:hypothetical protein
MPKVSTLSPVLFCLISICGNCQEGLTGYLVTGKDTIRGFIKGAIIAGSDGVSIRRNDSDSNHSVSDVTSINLSNGAVFVPAKSVGLDKNIFLEYLVKGKVSLFSYYVHGNDIFVITKDSKVIELDNSMQNITQNGINIERRSNRYRGQLRVHLGDAMQLNSKFERTPYKAKDLASLVKQYNALAAPDVSNEEFSHTQPFFTIQAGLSIGGGYTTLEVDDLLFEDHYGIKKSDFAPTAKYSAGAVLLISIRDIKNMWLAFRPAVFKASFKSDVSYTDYYYVHHQINFDFTGFHLPLSVGYALPLRHIKPFAEIGLSRTYLTDTKSDLRYTLTSPAGTTYQGQYDNFKFAKFQTGFLISLGVKAPIAQTHDIMGLKI